MGKEGVESEVSVPVVVNFVDDARNPSATTVSALPEKMDKLKNPDGKDKVEDKTPEQTKAEDGDGKEDTATSKEEVEDGEDDGVEDKKDAVTKRVDAISRKAEEAQERINEATKARRQKERELQAEVKKNQDLQKEIERLKTAKPVAVKPKIEDFETEAEFIEALTDWKLDTRMAAANDLQASNSVNHEEERISSIIRQQMKEGSKKYKDFNEVVKNENTPISTDMVKVISESEMGDEILYYLGTHLDKAEEISEMDMTSAALAIGRIEAELSRPIKKTTTKTPAPIKPVQTTQSYEPTLESVDYEEYKRRRKLQKK